MKLRVPQPEWNYPKNYTTIWELSIILKLHRYLTWGSLVERAESVMLLFIVLYRIELASLTFLSQFIFCRVTHSGSSHKSNSFEIDTHVTDQSWCSAISSLFVSLSLRSWKCYKFHFLSIHIHGILKAFFFVCASSSHPFYIILAYEDIRHRVEWLPNEKRMSNDDEDVSHIAERRRRSSLGRIKRK